MTAINRRSAMKTGAIAIASCAVCTAVPSLAQTSTETDEAMTAWREYVSASIADNDAYHAYDEAQCAARREAGQPWEYINVGTAGVYLRRGDALGGPSELVPMKGTTEELYEKGRELLKQRNREIRATLPKAYKRHGVSALKQVSDKAVLRRDEAMQAIKDLPASPAASLVQLAIWIAHNTKQDGCPDTSCWGKDGLYAAYASLMDLTGFDPVQEAFAAGLA